MGDLGDAPRRRMAAAEEDMNDQAKTMMLKYDERDCCVHMSLQAPQAGAVVAIYPISQPMIFAIPQQ